MAKLICLWLADLLLPCLLLAWGRRGVAGARRAGVRSGPAAQCLAALCRWFAGFLLLLDTADRLLSGWLGLMDPARLSLLNGAVGAALWLAVPPLVKLSLSGRGGRQGQSASAGKAGCPCCGRQGSHAA